MGTGIGGGMGGGTGGGTGGGIGLGGTGALCPVTGRPTAGAYPIFSVPTFGGGALGGGGIMGPATAGGTGGPESIRSLRLGSLLPGLGALTASGCARVSFFRLKRPANFELKLPI